MKSGLLWYDKSSSHIGDKIAQAAKRYQEKFGTMPDTAFVNPKDYSETVSVPKIQIKPKATIMPNHIWLGTTK